MSRYDAARDRARSGRRPGTRPGVFRAERDPARPKYYVLEMFPYPVGAHPHGPRPQLHHGRRGGALQAGARLQRAAPDGLGRLRHAGRERRHREGRASRRPGPTRTSPRCARRCSRWASRSTGAASSPPATPTTTASSRRCSSTCSTAGLVARKAAVVNWDPVDMTVLANEQVIDGRAGAPAPPVERRELTQWFFRISDMAEELLAAHRRPRRLAGEGPADAEELDRQEPGPAVPLRDPRRAGGLRDARGLHHPPRHPASARASPPSRPTIRWRRRWRRRPRASPPSSPSAAAWAPPRRSWRPPRSAASTPACGCVHPFDPAGELPVWIANFILMDYGTGAIFGCPAHDQRDLDFARKYGLPVIDRRQRPRAPEFDVGDDALPPKPSR